MILYLRAEHGAADQTHGGGPGVVAGGRRARELRHAVDQLGVVARQLHQLVDARPAVQTTAAAAAAAAAVCSCTPAALLLLQLA